MNPVNGATTAAPQGEVSSELIRAIVNLVSTGPVPLGAYTAHMMWFMRRFARAMAMLAEPASGGVSEP